MTELLGCQQVLCYVTTSYFDSANCMRELLRAAVTGKPIVALLELEAKHGGIDRSEIIDHLQKANSMYERWGLSSEVASWGYNMPAHEDLMAILFKHPPVEWNRIGAFQVGVVPHSPFAHFSELLWWKSYRNS